MLEGNQKRLDISSNGFSVKVQEMLGWVRYTVRSTGCPYSSLGLCLIEVLGAYTCTALVTLAFSCFNLVCLCMFVCHNSKLWFQSSTVCSKKHQHGGRCLIVIFPACYALCSLFATVLSCSQQYCKNNMCHTVRSINEI